MPKVQNPLPSKVLDGDPCQTALTPSQISTYFGGDAIALRSGSDGLGATCDYGNVRTSSHALVGYETKAGGGIGISYQTKKNTAKRWVELDPVQGYPAIGYAPAYLDEAHPKRNCVVVVGTSDQFAYSVSLTLSDNATAEGKDACMIGRTIADGVMTNLKARA